MAKKYKKKSQDLSAPSDIIQPIKLINPFNSVEDNLEYLELGEIPDHIINPFDVPIGEKKPDPIEEMVKVMMNKEYLHFACLHLLNIELLPYQLAILDTLWTRRMPLLVASRGSGKCIVGNSYCQTNQGLLRIDEIIKDNNNINTQINCPVDLTMKGENGYNIPSYGWNNGKTKTIKITLSSGLELEGTYNHPIRILRNEEILWEELSKIQEKDIVILDRNNYQFGSDEMDLDVAWWLGATLGDGMVSSPGTVAFTNIDKDIIENWIRIGKKLSGKNFVGNGKSNPDTYYIYSRVFNKYINKFMEFHGKKAKEKVIPLKIRKCNQNVVCNFLSGLFDTDGGMTKVGFEYCTASEELSIQVQTILLGLGIVSRRRKRNVKCNGKIFISYNISISCTKDLKILKEKIGFRCVRKQKSLDILSQRVSNPNKDLFPFNKKLIKLLDIKRDRGILIKNSTQYMHKMLSNYVFTQYTRSYETVDKFLGFLEFLSDTKEWQELKSLHTKNYFYDGVKKIEKSENYTYDVYIPNDHSFIANGFINHNSFLLAVYGLLRLVLHPGCRVVVCGSAFRQSKQIFEYMNTIWAKAPILRDISGYTRNVGIGPRMAVDRCTFTIGDSIAVFLPIGTGEKIRGIRANYILCDEFASINEEIFNVVIQGFAVVASTPVEKVKEEALIAKLKELGEWSEELQMLQKDRLGGNQIVYSGTASYAFNHFAKHFKKWHKIITSKGTAKDIFGDGDDTLKNFNWKEYAIIRLPYSQIPKGMMDTGIIAQAKATLTHNQFLSEYCAVFPEDSDGFYKRSTIESATTNKPILLQDGSAIQFSAMKMGDVTKAYVIGIDPAADQDNAAIVVLEMNTNHRKIVHCWTTNRKKYQNTKKEMGKRGFKMGDDYYRYIAKKIRSLMRSFNTERIIMDKNGGGIAIAEALSSEDTCMDGEFPVYELINPEEPKADDQKEGLHILQSVVPTLEMNADANHGMLKDLQNKVLLFPKFDTIEIAKFLVLDDNDDNKLETYEELAEEIEDLKKEMCLIRVIPSSALGKETFGIPKVKTDDMAMGYLRKDRYSALLYANLYARNKDKQEVFKIEYKPVGGTRETLRNVKAQSKSLYSGTGTLKFRDQKWNLGVGMKIVQKGK